MNPTVPVIMLTPIHKAKRETQAYFFLYIRLVTRKQGMLTGVQIYISILCKFKDNVRVTSKWFSLIRGNVHSITENDVF